ncbi:DNA polymerase III subunit delta [Adlercreutzia sp. ZJ141]|uniref:DNA polymerase III subunit delta n=1 Tax=Adlercreutzia sp. ZJ141 TaxID=2709406 RepID=UPI0013EB9638|nr:DNA polymerase III subunit delta [Adlercreutzia sp. ZJ141]
MANASKDTPLLPVYLIVGEDALKRDAVLKRLRTRLESKGDLAFNSDTFDGSTAVGTDIVSACNTVPFASDVRLVEVKAADHLKEADIDALVSYVKNPCATTVLALVADKMAKNRRLRKAVAAVGKSSVIECTPLKRYELPKTVRSMAVSHGFTMTDRAARLLVDLVGEDTVHLDAEVRKIALAHFGKRTVDERDVTAVVQRTAEAKPWEFVDAFASRDIRACMDLFGRMSSASPYALMAACTARVRELICVQSLTKRGQGISVADALGMPDWKVKHHAAWARGFTERELRCALISACDAERAMKSGADARTAFLDWALSVIVRK